MRASCHVAISAPSVSTISGEMTATRAALRTPLGVPYVEAVQVDALEDISSRLIESLGPRAYHERYREGARMTFDEAVSCALEELEASGK